MPKKNGNGDVIIFVVNVVGKKGGIIHWEGKRRREREREKHKEQQQKNNIIANFNFK